MDICPNDEPTGKKIYFAKKLLPFLGKLEKTLLSPPPSFGHQRVKVNLPMECRTWTPCVSVICFFTLMTTLDDNCKVKITLNCNSDDSGHLSQCNVSNLWSLIPELGIKQYLSQVGTGGKHDGTGTFLWKPSAAKEIFHYVIWSCQDFSSSQTRNKNSLYPTV